MPILFLRRLTSILANVLGSSVKKRLKKLLPLCPTCLITNFVKIWNVSRRFVHIGVFDITGVFVSVVNTPKLLVVVDAPLVYRRRNKLGIIARVKENIQKKSVNFVVISFTIV